VSRVYDKGVFDVGSGLLLDGWLIRGYAATIRRPVVAGWIQFFTPPNGGVSFALCWVTLS